MLGYVFGVSVLLVLTHAASLWAGSRFNGWLKAIPFLGRFF